MEKLSPDLVKAEVDRFWKSFQAKDIDALTNFYSPEATVFSSTGTRPEPGRLASARRQREYFHPKATVRVTIGHMDVVLLGDSGAVCGYSFDFDATHVASGLHESGDEHIRQGRVTQVFRHESNGELKIVHEHISVAPTQR